MTDDEKIQLGAVLEIVQSMQKTMVAMQDDIGAIQGVMATKDDLKNFATKDDLKNFATKGDLKNFATKDDVTDIRGDIAAIKEDVEFLKDSVATKDDLGSLKSEVFEHIDGFAQQNQKFDIELVAARSQFNRVEERVEVLELKAGIGA
ncbi:MAG: hypothetical protein AAB473_00345 [Patescibacteria group bacterium]